MKIGAEIEHPGRPLTGTWLVSVLLAAAGWLASWHTVLVNLQIVVDLLQCFGVHGGLCWGTGAAAEQESGLDESIANCPLLVLLLKLFFNLIHLENATKTTRQLSFVKLMGCSRLSSPPHPMAGSQQLVHFS